MTKLTIINDTHLGVSRSSGTTKESAANLNRWQFEQFSKLLEAANGSDLLINGDLFDRFEVSKAVEFETFLRLSNWINSNPGRTLYMSAGNHDLSTNSERRSSFENLCYYLTNVHPNSVTTIIGVTFTNAADKWAVVSHMPTQELFEQELDKALAASGLKYLFVHANLMSPFAVHSDHSLNVSEEYLDKFKSAGVTVVFAHEHNRRILDNAVVVGNQIPSSISDCLDPNPTKQYAVLEGGTLQGIDFITISDVYTVSDWQDLPEDKLFIRLEGQAEYEQSAEVVQTVSTLRKNSQAFVISNAVRVAQVAGLEAQDQGLESLDVRQMILDELPAELAKRFKELTDHD